MFRFQGLLHPQPLSYQSTTAHFTWMENRGLENQDWLTLISLLWFLSVLDLILCRVILKE